MERERDAAVHLNELRSRDINDLTRIVRRLVRDAHGIDPETLKDIKNSSQPIFTPEELKVMDQFPSFCPRITNNNAFQ